MFRALIQRDVAKFGYRITLTKLIIGIAMPLSVILVSDLSVIGGWRIALPVSLIAVGGDPVEFAIASIALIPLTISILFEQGGWRIVLAMLMTGIVCNFAMQLKVLLQSRTGHHVVPTGYGHFSRRSYIRLLTLIPYSIPTCTALEFLLRQWKAPGSSRLSG